MTFLPMAYLFTLFKSDYWYYYAFTSALAMLGSYLFYHVIAEVSEQFGEPPKVILQYQLLGLLVCIFFIVAPLLAFNYFDYLNGIVLNFMFGEGTQVVKQYTGPSIALAIVYYILLFHIHLLFNYTKAKIRNIKEKKSREGYQ